MADKPKTPQRETPNEVQGRDFFQTPNYAVDLLVPYIPKNIKNIWECASGHGKIVLSLEYYRYSVWSTDLKWDADYMDEVVNFLTGVPALRPQCIITNPPFSLKKKFYEKCIEYDLPFALLIPMDFNGWLCEAFDKYDCQGLVPNRRIDYITPTGLSGASGHTSYFHSFWLTRYFNLPHQLTFTELSIKDKENI